MYRRLTIRRGVLIAFAVLLSVIALIGAYSVATILNDNFHEVVAGELYRSAQPGGEALASIKARTGIRTIINLRGANPKAAWYQAEVQESARLGITLVDFRMKASRGLTMEQATALIRVMQKAEKPILIHCQSGIDRTGLASALYLAAIGKVGEEAAEDQLSIRYGHLSLPVLSGFAMDRTFELMEPSLGFSDS